MPWSGETEPLSWFLKLPDVVCFFLWTSTKRISDPTHFDFYYPNRETKFCYPHWLWDNCKILFWALLWGGFHVWRPQNCGIFLPPPLSVRKMYTVRPKMFCISWPLPKYPFLCGRHIWKPTNAFCTYALVEFSPVLVRAGVCPALILGVHANLGRVLSGEGPEIMDGQVRLTNYFTIPVVSPVTRHCTAVSRNALVYLLQWYNL